MLHQVLVSCGILEGSMREWTKCGRGLGIYGLLRDSVIMPKLERGVLYIHELRWFLE